MSDQSQLEALHRHIKMSLAISELKTYEQVGPLITVDKPFLSLADLKRVVDEAVELAEKPEEVAVLVDQGYETIPSVQDLVGFAKSNVNKKIPGYTGHGKFEGQDREVFVLVGEWD